MKGIYRLFILLTVFSMGFLASCERNDDEPLLPKTPISRLYVSFSNVPASDLADPFNNIGVFDPAHAESFSNPFSYNSGVLEGAGIFFDPFSGRVFQGSFRNQSIKSFSVNSQGAVGTGPTFKDSTLLYQRDLVYDPSSKNLYVSDNLDQSIYVYAQALNRNGEVSPNKKFELEGQPWGLYFHGDTTRGDTLLVAIAGEAAQVQLYENVSKLDSGAVSPSRQINISGATDLRGITYSRKLDVLVLTDFGSARIYIIENARQAFTNQGQVVPTRVISGNGTQLQSPIDVAIDDREDKMLLYVADRESRRILRFNLSDNGDASPNGVHQFTTLIPVSIHLDAR